MTETAIEVNGITKTFRLSASAGSLKTRLIDLIKKNRGDTFTALDNVTFSVKRGETLGLIGANGAGKSTLLSIIAGTMYPTRGTVKCSGSISSLLELGAGFHPDLTGRENVLLYGAIMGIPRETMLKKFDNIVDFSGLEKFIDQPVRFYSSGMYVRLGFAVAVQVDPDILLIDEVLAVGDSDFQRKCLDKMNEFRRKGKSMLIISHDMHTIKSISDRIAYLDHGRLKGIGDPDSIAARYGADSLYGKTASIRREWGTGEARLTGIKILGEDGAGCGTATRGRVLAVRISWEAANRIDTPTFGFSISDDSGRTIFGSNTEIDGADIPFIQGQGTVTLYVDTSSLASGNYMLSFSLHSRDHKINYHRLDNHTPVCLDDETHFDGICRLPTKWEIR